MPAPCPPDDSSIRAGYSRSWSVQPSAVRSFKADAKLLKILIIGMIVLLTNLLISSISLAMLESACKMWKFSYSRKFHGVLWSEMVQ